MATMRHIELQLPPYARSTDPSLLAFLAAARVSQPTKAAIADFFGGRRLAVGRNCRQDRDVYTAVERWPILRSTASQVTQGMAAVPWLPCMA